MAGDPKCEERLVSKMGDDGGVVVELSLGLSVGRSTQKAPEVAAPQPLRGFVTDLMPDPSTVLPLFPTDDSHLLDPEHKREYQALRRKEAKRKQDEKLLRKGIQRGRNSPFQACTPRASSTSPEDRAVLESQEQQSRAKDREVKETQASEDDRSTSCRKGRENNEQILEPNPNITPSPIPTPKPTYNQIPNPNPSTAEGSPVTVLNPNSISTANPSPVMNPNRNPTPFPVMPMQLPYPPMTVVPYGSGYAIPCMLPCWAPAVPTVPPLPMPPPPPPAAAAGPGKGEKSVFQPVPIRALPPSAPSIRFNGKLKESIDQEKNAGKEVFTPRVPSWKASLGKSPSDVSEYHTGSIQGGSSSSSAGSSLTVAEKRQLRINPLHIPRGHSDQNISYQHKVAPGVAQPSSISKTDIARPQPKKPEGSATVKRQALVAATANMHRNVTSESAMPCVVTRGDDGTTVTGFLFNYSTSDVCIMCVCHGSTFTPAEFVKHAGCSDMGHPLKHIVVVP